ncbi:mRNA export protein (contains WD40 repeats) [Plasmopara halstedii]|uniref:mRNA export protein (Contains WD40 repeats) n=1 Tax=Plasmopara halstedii TaxID=4781 RepID=A0A0P1B6V3_PLAHL|nr:mRNA export protein (contains WD40 repeats) [Plasmopara halstedii]CEG50231.1 mRNA export protein (contains WD40 repeats) [Plasmopara halstedii]|eukprot:XP_024586600.1 mRNA export protein (contains WD40 repeats) [Plasmopara halstedii]
MSFGQPAGGYLNPNNDYTIGETINDGIQDLAWSPTSNILVSGSWDNYVRCWEVQQQGMQFNAVAKAQIAHDGPVLCTTFSGDGSTVFSGSCDKTAKMWVLNGPAQGQQIAAHDAPIRSIAFIQEANCVATGSWDKTLKYWDTRSPTPMASVQLSERCYAMDVRHPLLVVATADRMVHVVDIRKPSQIYKSIQSNLKFQTRTIACFPDASGFAVGSVEGRCSIQYVEDKDKRNDFAFKCHRDGSDIYPVSSIAFHPFGTFATTGGDGTFCFWDKDARQKLKTFNKCNQSITTGKFNARGDIFAYTLSYDWSMGVEKYNPNQPSVIRLHSVAEAEIKQKKKPASR